MKKKTIKRAPKLPAFNGRSQVWLSKGNSNGGGCLRVIDPDGGVLYGYEGTSGLDYGCTSKDTQKQAVKVVLRHCLASNLPIPKFVGYL